MKKVILLIFVFSTAIGCDFHFGMENLSPKTCVKEVNSTYVAGENTKFTIYRIESQLPDLYAISTWHNRTWLFLKQKPRDYFVDGKIFKYSIVNCPDQKRAKKGMKAKIKSLDLWKK